jgi:murein DD-endopeptidase MepM/ murein hydrolase activator NlpD
MTVAFAGALLLAAIGWRYASDRKAAITPLMSLAAASSRSEGASAAVASHYQTPDTAPRMSAITAKSAATPFFASYKSLRLRLPVPVSALTEIGFHQAAYPYALHMKTTMADAKLADARRLRSTGRATDQPTGPDAVLQGQVLRMWRPRAGKPDSAADVGGRPGTPVLSPVDGTVVKIKAYKLYGRWDDYEIHIQPDGFSNIDLVLIHVTNLAVAVGDQVTGGVTQLASIRKLSDKYHDQLADYTRGGGDHVHVQLNNADYPGYKCLQGAIDPETDNGITPSVPSTPLP